MFAPVVTNGSNHLRPDALPRLTPQRALAEVVAELSAVERDALPSAACRVLADVLPLDEARFVTNLGEVGSWARVRDRRRSIRRHSVQTAVSGATERPLQWRDGNQTLLAVPVRRSGRRLAVLLGSTAASHEFTDRELHQGELVAAAVAEVEGDPETERQHESAERPLEAAVSEIEVGWAAVEALKAVLEFDACRVYLPGPGDNRVAPVVQCGVGQTAHTEAMIAGACAPGVGAAGRAMVDGRSRIIPNSRIEPHASKIVAAIAADESLLVVPVMVHDEAVAVIVVARIGADKFTRSELRQVERVAMRTASAFRAVGLFRKAAEQARVSQALLDLGEALGAQTGVDGVAAMLAAAADRLIECAAVSVWLREGDEMRLASGRGYTPDEMARLADDTIAADAPLFAEALDRREVVVRPFIAAEPIASRLDGTLDGSTFAVVAVGERAANRAAVVVQRGPRRGAPSPLERQMLHGIADQTLIALTNRMLYAELDQWFLATVQALATALETKDEYTGEHAIELEELCTTVAAQLGLTGAELRNVTLGALLHDIGKIGIPSLILNKPAPLTEAEWEVMRRHPELGARIIEPVAGLDGARELVIACHEHWDGSGYPNGLAGEAIPLGARIILTCDAYHAMTSDRVYRAALPVSEAILELQRHAGTQFDPAVADALVAVIGE
jgi:HD-GYP domain-containing protein (c-di-GMP phosphodiesterase class II)